MLALSEREPTKALDPAVNQEYLLAEADEGRGARGQTHDEQRADAQLDEGDDPLQPPEVGQQDAVDEDRALSPRRVRSRAQLGGLAPTVIGPAATAASSSA